MTAIVDAGPIVAVTWRPFGKAPARPPVILSLSKDLDATPDPPLPAATSREVGVEILRLRPKTAFAQDDTSRGGLLHRTASGLFNYRLNRSAAVVVDHPDAPPLG